MQARSGFELFRLCHSIIAMTSLAGRVNSGVILVSLSLYSHPGKTLWMRMLRLLSTATVVTFCEHLRSVSEQCMALLCIWIKMMFLLIAAVGLLFPFAFIVIAWSIYPLTNDRRRVNFAIQEAMRDEASVLVFGSHPPLPIRNVNGVHVTEPIIHRTLRSDQRGYQAPNRARGYSACHEPLGVMRVEVYPLQESSAGIKGTSVRV